MSKQTKRSRWQAIVDDSLLKTNQVTQAAIYGLDGTRWASTSDLQVGLNHYFLLHSMQESWVGGAEIIRCFYVGDSRADTQNSRMYNW